MCTLNIPYAIRKVVGKIWLIENESAFLSKVDSQFITICMDILMDAPLIQALSNAFILPSFYTANDMDIALSHYHFDYGLFPYSGFLPLSQLLVDGWFG